MISKKQNTEKYEETCLTICLDNGECEGVGCINCPFRACFSNTESLRRARQWLMKYWAEKGLLQQGDNNE